MQKKVKQKRDVGSQFKRVPNELGLPTSADILGLNNAVGFDLIPLSDGTFETFKEFQDIVSKSNQPDRKYYLPASCDKPLPRRQPEKTRGRCPFCKRDVIGLDFHLTKYHSDVINRVKGSAKAT